MSTGTPGPVPQMLRLLRAELHQADDAKIRQIVALIDNLPDQENLQPLLEPIRPRLASLHPHRPLRFVRLLFIPFDGLIVAAPDWRPGSPSIPRTVLRPIADVVRAGLGNRADAVERMISNQDTAATGVITEAGELVWAAAADILASSAPPDSWAETGLRPAAYAPLVGALAVVFRRALPLWNLRRDAELGVIQASEHDIRKLVVGAAGESAEGSFMICKQILTYLPMAATLLASVVTSCGDAERLALQAAMDSATDAILSAFERNPKVIEASGASAGTDIQRIVTLFGQLEAQTAQGQAKEGQNKSRLNAIRKTLDSAFRSRLVGSMTEGIVTPLAGLSAIPDTAGQQRLEATARTVRALELAGRKFGDAAAYDTLNATAMGAIAKASGRGTLDRLKTARLVEILAGPDAAQTFYESGRL